MLFGVNKLFYTRIYIVWCMFIQSEIVSARFIMKMDDDAFVRIDEVLSRLEGKTGKGLVYGRISFDSAPNRDKDNKWFISEEV